MGNKTFGKGYYDGYNDGRKNKTKYNIFSAIFGFTLGIIATLLGSKSK